MSTRRSPERVVDGDQAACADQLEALLVIKVQILLVGVDEGKIETAGCSGVDQLRECVGRRRQAQVDAVGDARFAPVAPGNFGPFLADVAAGQLAVGREHQRHGKRAISGERADLERAPGVDETHEQAHELRLLRADLQAGVGQTPRLGAQSRHELRFAQSLVEQIGVKPIVQNEQPAGIDRDGFVGRARRDGGGPANRRAARGAIGSLRHMVIL